jgi:cell division protein FtsB
MKNINVRKIYYHARHRVLTTNNMVIIVGLFIAASWAWGSVQAMERNYGLQKQIDYKQRQLKLAQLETQTLQYEQNYYKSDEYKELAVRERLGLAAPGEKVLILPPNSKQASSADITVATVSAPRQVAESNVQQWVNFLFGGAYRKLQK